MWIYPPEDGFTIAAITKMGIKANLTLPIGAHVDKFSAVRGRSLAPAATSFGNRIIPPQSLNKYISSLTQSEPNKRLMIITQKDFIRLSCAPGVEVIHRGELYD